MKIISCNSVSLALLGANVRLLGMTEGLKRNCSDFRNPKETGSLHWVIVFHIRRCNSSFFAESVTLKICRAGA